MIKGYIPLILFQGCENTQFSLIDWLIKSISVYRTGITKFRKLVMKSTFADRNASIRGRVHVTRDSTYA